MKHIQLQSLTINHFKGIEHYSITLDGKSMDIFGDNDAGKTSIYDAFLWVLYHKDSRDRTHFHWKPLDEHNQPIDGLQTSVKVVLLVDGKERSFEKVKTSKKVLKRKLERSVFEDASSYLIDGLKTETKKIYDEKVSEVVDAETFRKLSSIRYFMHELLAKERRETLFNYFGAKSDLEIIQETPELKDLLPIVDHSNVIDERTKHMQEAKTIAETLKSIPIKIEGIQSVMPEITDMNRDALTTQRLKQAKELADLQDQLVNIKHGGAAGEYRSQLRLKETELEEARLSHEYLQKAKTAGIEEGKAKVFAELNKKKQQLIMEENKHKSIQLQIDDEKQTVERLQAAHEKLIEEYDTIDDLEFAPAVFTPIAFDESALSCAYCGTTYPTEKQDEMRKHHEAEEARRKKETDEKNAQHKEQFEKEKEADLKAIRLKGQSNNQERESAEKRMAELAQQLSEITLDPLRKEIEEQEQRFQELSKQIEALQGETIAFESTPKYAEITEQIIFYQKAIENSEATIAEQIDKQSALIEEAEKTIAKIDQKLAMFAELDRQNQAIEQLNEQERELSARKGEILEVLALFDGFFIKKRDLLQTHIDSHFSMVNWKLFDFSKDGNLIEDYCEPVIEGVPYSDLNNGSQMQAGLDIANTLMKQEGYLLPIIIDNAEGMTTHKREEVTIDTQVIAMYVSEPDKNLRLLPKGE